VQELATFLNGEVYRVLLVFARVGTAAMFLPGFGETAVPAHVRLGIAGVCALAIAPMVNGLPVGIPGDGGELVRQLGAEILVGSFIGVGGRLFFASLQVAGTIIGQAIGLSNPFGFAAAGFEGGTVISTGLVMAALAFVFAADLHYAMIGALVRSYRLMPPDAPPDLGDLAGRFAELVAATFRLGAELTAPFLILNVLFNVALGLANRVMPSLPLSFVTPPATIAGGAILLMLTAGAVIATMADGFGAWLSGF
jgi:flagellar biosynthesis protein FliR